MPGPSSRTKATRLSLLTTLDANCANADITLESKGGKSTKRADVEEILEPASLNFFERLGDWFLLHLVIKNLNPLLVNDLIKQLHKEEMGDNSNTETLKLKPESSSV